MTSKWHSDQCPKGTFKKGKLTETLSIKLDINTTIQELEQEESYKYLGINEGDGIQHSRMKEKIRKEYYRNEIKLNSGVLGHFFAL